MGAEVAAWRSNSDNNRAKQAQRDHQNAEGHGGVEQLKGNPAKSARAQRSSKRKFSVGCYRQHVFRGPIPAGLEVRQAKVSWPPLDASGFGAGATLSQRSERWELRRRKVIESILHLLKLEINRFVLFC